MLKKQREDLTKISVQGRRNKAGVTPQGRQVPFRAVTWNPAGLAEDSLESFLVCARVTICGDVVLLQEYFRKLEGLPTEGCHMFFLGSHSGKRSGDRRCPAVIVQNRIGDECDCMERGDQWVAVGMRGSWWVSIGALINAPLEYSTLPLHEIEQLIRMFPDHEVMLGMDANTKVRGSEDGGTWDQTPSHRSSFPKMNGREFSPLQMCWPAPKML